MKITKTAIGNHLRRSPNGDVSMYRNGFKDGVNWTLQKAQAQAAYDTMTVECLNDIVKRQDALLKMALNALELSRDDVALCLEQNKQLVGYERYDKRINFYTEQLAKHDAAIAAIREAVK